MKRFALLIACALMIASSGCCWHQPYGNCGCGYGSGAGYAPTYAPAYAPSTCPGGNCGAYPSGAAIAPTQAAYIPYTTTASLDYLPAY
jgi:hypothetical protein